MFLGSLLKPFMHGHIVVTITADGLREAAESFDDPLEKMALIEAAKIFDRLPNRRIRKVPFKW